MGKIKLYKFRELTTCRHFDRTIDILEKNEFYCPKFYEMNDPMEGVYISTDRSKIDENFDEKDSKRICSFSNKKGFENLAMWGYYTNGFKGIAIEIDVNEEDVNEVKYRCNVPITNDIEKILTTKLKCWEHESEYRFISNDGAEYQKIGKITKVYFGLPYENLTNSKNIVSKNQKIQEYKKLKDKLKEFLQNKKIDFCDFEINLD